MIGCEPRRRGPNASVATELRLRECTTPERIHRDSAKEGELVVRDTVNTMPEKILLAFAAHGEVEGDKVTGRAPEAQQVRDALSGVGIPAGRSSPWRLTAARGYSVVGRSSAPTVAR